MKFLILYLFLVSCASLTNENIQNINIATNNNTATKISINSQSFNIPGIIGLPRSENDLILKVENENCTNEYYLNSEIDNIFWVNTLISGPFGSTTDFATEKMWKYQDTVVIYCK